MRRIPCSYRKILIISCLSYVWGSCGTAVFHTNRTIPARVGEPTSLTLQLKNLPEPAEPLIVAVYQFRDQTGQYKPQENGAGFSTAVTQGAANILVKVLQDSKWFTPIERENISDLLNERKIIRSTRQQFGMNEELPALLYAGLLLEGGIVSYDANVVTGGAGLRYFGAGGSSEYRQDRVTVYLRAISVTNGKILKTVYASKMILSQSVDGGMFRFVRFQRLLEAETGFTFNEPSEMAVTEAIEKAVESLIYEGIADGLWSLKDNAKKKEILEHWKQLKAAEERVDVLNQLTDDRRKKVSLSIDYLNLLYRGDYAGPRWRAGGGAGLAYHFSPAGSLNLRVGSGTLATRRGFQTQISTAQMTFTYRYTPYYTFSPLVQLGGGIVQNNLSNRLLPHGYVEAGFEYLWKKNWGIAAGAGYHYLFSDLLDERQNGLYNDTFWQVKLGINFYFGKKIQKKTLPGTAAPAEKPKGILQDF